MCVFNQIRDSATLGTYQDGSGVSAWSWEPDSTLTKCVTVGSISPSWMKKSNGLGCGTRTTMVFLEVII